MLTCCTSFFFFFNDTATTEIYTLSLHDALPILGCCANRLASCRRYTGRRTRRCGRRSCLPPACPIPIRPSRSVRSEEHTSELQSQSNLVCRLLLEKKNNNKRENRSTIPLHALCV